MSREHYIRIPDFLEKDEPLCAQTDPEVFFAQNISDVDGRSVYMNERQAKAICKQCPLINDCLAYALQYDEQGIWGGTTERERSRIRRVSGVRAINRRNDRYL